MSALKYVELVFGWLAGVTAAILAVIPLFMPDESMTGRAILNGKVVSEVHHEVWLVDMLGAGGTIVLVSALLLLAVTLALGVTIHVRGGQSGMLVILWIAPIALAGILIEFWRDLGGWLEYPMLLGIACAFVATLRQVYLPRAAAPE